MTGSLVSSTTERQMREMGRRVLANPSDGQDSPGRETPNRGDRVRVHNVGEEAVPSFGVMEITGWGEELDGHYEINKPTDSDSPVGYLINGREEIAANGIGWGSLATIRPVIAQIDPAGVPFGAKCGPVEDSYAMSSDGTGYRLMSEEIGASPKRAYVMRDTGASSCGLHHIAILPATSGQEEGLYQYFCSDPDTPVLVKPAARGHCPSSGSSGGDGGACTTEGYDPGGTWVPGELNGYNAAWYSPDCDPPADPLAGEWELVVVSEGDVIYCTWRNFLCGWIAYGAGYSP